MASTVLMRLAAGSGPTFGVDDLACAAATHLGLWADEGLEVRWTPVHGGVAAIAALLDGSVDAAYGGLGPLLGFRGEGKPVKAVVSMARSLAQNLVTRRAIASPEALRGASWAIDGFGALSHHMALLVTRALELEEGAVRWEAVGPPPERIARLLAGTIDASLVRVEEAVALHLDPGNDLHTLLDFAALKALAPLQPHGVLSTTEENARARPDAFARLARGMIRASRALHDEFDTFERVYKRFVTVTIPDEHVRAIWVRERDAGGFALNGEATRRHWDAQIASYTALHPERPRLGFADVFDTRFVEGALAALGVRPGPDAP